MEIKKKKLISIVTWLAGVVLIITGGFLFFKTEKVVDVVKTETVSSTSVTNLPVEPKKEDIKKTTGFVENNEWLSATISIDGYSQVIKFLEGDTLLDAMTRAMGNSQFSFFGKEFYGIGFFVDQINKKKSENSYSWIYYINGKQASVGVSTYKVASGDQIEWKYEKNY